MEKLARIWGMSKIQCSANDSEAHQPVVHNQCLQDIEHMDCRYLGNDIKSQSRWPYCNVTTVELTCKCNCRAWVRYKHCESLLYHLPEAKRQDSDRQADYSSTHWTVRLVKKNGGHRWSEDSSQMPFWPHRFDCWNNNAMERKCGMRIKRSDAEVTKKSKERKE